MSDTQTLPYAAPLKRSAQDVDGTDPYAFLEQSIDAMDERQLAEFSQAREKIMEKSRKKFSGPSTDAAARETPR